MGPARRGDRTVAPLRPDVAARRRRCSHHGRDRRAPAASCAWARAHERVRPREGAAGTLRAMTEAAREWAKRLGTVGVWTFEAERMPAAAEREYARAAESPGFQTLWIPPSRGS